MTIKSLDLFSGIGGFALGLGWTGGFETVAFCEQETYCQRILQERWPGVPVFDDVRTLSADALRYAGIDRVDAIVGGFPCQDVSIAGRQAGITGNQTGLWSEFRRLVGEIRPRYVLAENVTGLLGWGFADVLRDFAALGYAAMWECIPASAVGAPHRRDRLWVLAYTDSDGQLQPSRHICKSWRRSGNRRCAFPDADEPRLAIGRHGQHHEAELPSVERSDWWSAEPSVGRVADGFPGRVDAIKALGNAVVPQVVQLWGRAIIAMELEHGAIRDHD